MKDKVKKEIEEVSKTTQKPNILLLGGSGAGKSSLVNAVFGKTLAEIGEGKPITQTYSKFSGENSPVVSKKIV
jgi:predicted GTPase